VTDASAQTATAASTGSIAAALSLTATASTYTAIVLLTHKPTQPTVVLGAMFIVFPQDPFLQEQR